MSDSMPNCVVTVHFAEFGPSFSYTCAFCSNGWQVTADGTIHPPPKTRRIEFRLKGCPNAASFAGFQVASDPQDFPSESTPWALSGGISPPPGTPFPTGTERVPGPLVLDFGDQATPLFYRLAVVTGQGVPHWDDPRIYDDGTS
jgi:hypothetical protein